MGLDEARLALLGNLAGEVAPRENEREARCERAREQVHEAQFSLMTFFMSSISRPRSSSLR